MDNKKYDCQKFFINGEWVKPHANESLNVTNPATEQVIGSIAMGDETDVNNAVAAAKAAFETFSQTTTEERAAMLNDVCAAYEKRIPELAELITAEIGAPKTLSESAQATSGLGHMLTGLEVLKTYPFEEVKGSTVIRREGIGVCALITPWNWPINQIASKFVPAFIAGCTMVLKPSEIAPLNAIVFAEILEEAGIPKGVFNLVNGDGPTVGTALSSHPDVEMVSFTGSTRAGALVAEKAAPTIKRVTQELGGKSANIILEDADLAAAATHAVQAALLNCGQSCNAPQRILIPRDKMDEMAKLLSDNISACPVGDPTQETTVFGPLASKMQWDKVQRLIQTGIDENAELVCGGAGKPVGLEEGCFVKPTLFKDVNNNMTIAREEIFGPVLMLLPYDSVDEAVSIANDTVYGLSACVSGSHDKAIEVANRIRSGNVIVNGADVDFFAPFGGYKQSGNGREWGEFGIDDFVEIKAVIGGSLS